MKHLFPILFACMSALACSSHRMKMDGGAADGFTFDVEPGDGGGGDAVSSDGGGGDAVSSDGGGGDAVSSDANGIDARGGDADSGTNDAGARAPLCDGTAHLRLWALIDPGNELRGSAVRVENGGPFLAIDGTCSYWIGGGWVEDALSRDRPIRTGKVSAADAATIEQQVSDIAALADCPPPPPGLYDYSFRRFRTATANASCLTGAPALTAGTRFEAAWRALETIAVGLWNAGTPVTGALHVSAVNASDGATAPPAYAWPITAPLASFVLAGADETQVGVSHLVEDLTTASQLRALRDRYLTDRTAQPGLYANWDGLKATDQTTTAFVYMRDAIPYEDAAGLLTF